MRQEQFKYKRILIFLLGAILMSHAVGGCGIYDASSAAPELLEPVEVSLKGKIVSRGDIQDVVVYKGSVKEGSVSYAFPQGCYVNDLLICPGQEIKKGDLIAEVNMDEFAKEINDLCAKVEYLEEINRIETALADIDVEESSSSLTQMKLEYNQIEEKTPMDRSVVEEMERNHNILVEQRNYNCEQRKFEIEKAKAELAAVSGKADNQNIYATSDGRVLYVKDYTVDNPSGYTNADEIVAITTKEDEHYISSEMPIVTAREADEIYAVIGTQKYELAYVPYEDEEMKRAATLDLTLKTRFSCEEDLSGLVGEEVTVYAISNFEEDVIHISPDSLFTENNVSFVYLLKDGEKVKCEVETGTYTKNAVEIISGLEEGATVYCQANDVPSSKHVLVSAKKDKLEITKRYDQAKVSSLITGQVVNHVNNAVLQELLVKNGDEVKKGDVIAYLMVSQGESAISENQIELNNLKRAYDYEILQYTNELKKKQKQLDSMVKEKTTSTMAYKKVSAEARSLQLKIDKENVTYEYETGNLRREMAENERTKGRIALCAPMSGTVREVTSLVTGYSIEKYSLLCKIVPKECECVKLFTEGVNVPIGSKVTVMGTQNAEFAGKVVSCYHDISGVIYEDGMYLNETSAQINDATWVVLEDGNSYENLDNVGVKINVWNVEDAILVDSKCVYLQGDKKTGKRYVWVSEDGDLYKRYVTVGYLDGNIAWIVQGLSEGEQIVLETAVKEG